MLLCNVMLVWFRKYTYMYMYYQYAYYVDYVSKRHFLRQNKLSVDYIISIFIRGARENLPHPLREFLPPFPPINTRREIIIKVLLWLL